MVPNITLPESSGPLPPPKLEKGVLAWLRKNLFSDLKNTALTLLGLLLIYWIAAPIFMFAVVNAIWFGDDGAVCRVPDAGACWPLVKNYFGQYIYGLYPIDERWRVNLVFLMGLCGLVPMLMPSLPGKMWNLIFLLGIFPVATFFLLIGDAFGLRHVPSEDWGGVLVTLVVAVCGIAASLPLGILLALGRRSQLPIIRMASIGFIEFWRGIPLITVLFMASVMLPLFLPDGVTFDGLLRCLIGVALFSSAYMAEVVRGGLQAIPRGQSEGAMALGLGYWQATGLIVLPQALKHVIPGIVNTFIGLFKDTTLVSTVQIFDLLGFVQRSSTDPAWLTPVTAWTGYLFAAIVFWIFCFAMSRYSKFMEDYLHTGHRR